MSSLIAHRAAPAKPPAAGALHRSIGGGFIAAAACVKLQAGRKSVTAGRVTASESGRGTLRANNFELALLASQASCDEALAALREQQALLERRFGCDEEGREHKHAARALIVGSTKAVRNLVEVAHRLETEATDMQRRLLCDDRAVRESHSRSLREQHACHAAALCSMRTELKIAEVADKLECERVRAHLEKQLRDERAERILLQERAQGQVERDLAELAAKSVALRELQAQLEAQRVHHQSELDDAAADLRQAEARERKVIDEAKVAAAASAEVQQRQVTDLGMLSREKRLLESSVRDVKASRAADRDAADAEQSRLQKAAHEALRKAATLEHQIQLMELATSRDHALLEKMRRLSAIAVGGASVGLSASHSHTALSKASSKEDTTAAGVEMAEAAQHIIVAEVVGAAPGARASRPAATPAAAQKTPTSREALRHSGALRCSASAGDATKAYSKAVADVRKARTHHATDALHAAARRNRGLLYAELTKELSKSKMSAVQLEARGSEGGRRSQSTQTDRSLSTARLY